MKITRFVEKSNVVRADSPEAMSGFRKWCEISNEWDHFVPMDDNSPNLYIRRTIQEGRSIFIEPNYVLVFNLQFNCAALVKADEMVEPVDLTVNVERKEE